MKIIKLMIILLIVGVAGFLTGVVGNHNVNVKVVTEEVEVTKEVTKEVIKEIEVVKVVREQFDKVMYIAVYHGKDQKNTIKETSDPTNIDKKDLEYLVTIHFTADGYSLSVISVMLLSSDGSVYEFAVKIPGKHHISYEHFPLPDGF